MIEWFIKVKSYSNICSFPTNILNKIDQEIEVFPPTAFPHWTNDKHEISFICLHFQLLDTIDMNISSILTMSNCKFNLKYYMYWVNKGMKGWRNFPLFFRRSKRHASTMWKSLFARPTKYFTLNIYRPKHADKGKQKNEIIYLPRKWIFHVNFSFTNTITEQKFSPIYRFFPFKLANLEWRFSLHSSFLPCRTSVEYLNIQYMYIYFLIPANVLYIYDVLVAFIYLCWGLLIYHFIYEYNMIHIWYFNNLPIWL